MPTCLATPPSRIRSTSTSPAAPPPRGTGTRCRPAAASRSSDRARLRPVRRVGRHRLRLRPEHLPPEPAQQPKAIGPRAPAARLVPVGRADPAPAPARRSPSPGAHAGRLRRHGSLRPWDRPSPSPRPGCAETPGSSESCRTSPGRSRRACRTRPPPGTDRPPPSAAPAPARASAAAARPPPHVGLDRRRLAGVRARSARSAPHARTSRGEARQPGAATAPPSRTPTSPSPANPGWLDIEPALASPSTRSQVRSTDAADRRVQRLGQPAQLDLEGAVRPADLAEMPAEHAAPAAPAAPSPPASAGSPRRRTCPARMSSSLTAALAQRPDRLGVVHAQPGRRLQRARVHPAARPVHHAVEGEVAVVIGEAELRAVPPPHPPAAAEPRRAAVEPRLQLRIDRAHQTRTSTTGIDGISPAANPARLALIRSVSNRTGTSNSKPAVTTAPAAGAASETHLPGRRDRPRSPPRRQRRRPPTATRTCPRPAWRSAAHRPAPPRHSVLLQRERGPRPVAGPDRLVERRGRRRRRARLEVGPVLPAEAIAAAHAAPRRTRSPPPDRPATAPRAPRHSAAANAPRASCAPRSRCSASRSRSAAPARRSTPPTAPPGNLTSWKFIALPLQRLRRPRWIARLISAAIWLCDRWKPAASGVEMFIVTCTAPPPPPPGPRARRPRRAPAA